jgi:hypothetical protein
LRRWDAGPELGGHQEEGGGKEPEWRRPTTEEGAAFFKLPKKLEIFLLYFIKIMIILFNFILI